MRLSKVHFRRVPAAELPEGPILQGWVGQDEGVAGSGVAGVGVAGGVSLSSGLEGCLQPGKESVRPSRDMRGLAGVGSCEPRALPGRGALCTKARPGGGPAAGTVAAPGNPARGRPRSRNSLVSQGPQGAVTSGPAHKGECHVSGLSGQR